LSRPGCKIADLANDLGVSEQTIYTWRRQERIDRGLIAGLRSEEREELAAAQRRVRELEAELEIHRRASELLADRSDPKGGSRRSR
jgi:transposase